MQTLSDNYAAIYDKLLEEVGDDQRVKLDAMNAFWPMWGHQFSGDLMVIGRCTNGWMAPWRKDELTQPRRRRQILRDARGFSESKHRCPLLWLTDNDEDSDYNARGSAFWRVVRRVVLEGKTDQIGSDNWPSFLCWSNLLKLAPTATNVQPTVGFRAAQTPRGAKLIEQEVAEMQPRRVLVLAGRDWFTPFAQALGLDVVWQEGLVEGIAVQPDRRWVIAKHPTLKSEEEHVDDIIESFAGRARAAGRFRS